MPADSIDEGEVAAAWDQNADRWTSDVRDGFDLYRELYTLPAFLSFMPEIAGLRVIDLGCGEGSNTRRFAGLGGQLTGVDLSPAMIAFAQEEERRRPLGVHYEIRSFSDLKGFDANSFDAALSTMALMDGPDFPAAVREAHRLLIPGGFLCFSILHPCFITPDVSWVRSQDGGYAGLQVGRYFDPTSFIENWIFSKRPRAEAVEPFAIPRFPRTLSDYINPLCATGFRISAVEEPRPDEDTSREHPWLARWRAHAPLVLFILAHKDRTPVHPAGCAQDG